MRVASTNIGTELLFENDVVRVWDMRLKPGEIMPYHVHRKDYVIIYVTPSRISLMETPPDVKATRNYEDGYVHFVPVEGETAHQIRNDADIPHRQVLVEFKTRNGLAPNQDNHRASKPL